MLRRFGLILAAILPLCAAVACTLRVEALLRAHNESGGDWYEWLMIAVAAGAGIPSLPVRLGCTFVIAALVFLAGYSVGLLYLPALGLSILAALVQLSVQK